ncbi:response regulator [Zavarzinella formosa]|uniref:response regulator n=1 Tax=Zavarzinella formosa TaxID=360055 RepID=UPI00059361E1|nr:response regulator [Zavarzinella formosa]
MPNITPNAPGILCVDDNQDGADMCATLLKMCGFDARACYDGETALRMAVESPPALCFIDLNMPGMEGDELAQRLRELMADHAIKLVALTAMARDEDFRRTDAAGFDLHLIKPADPMELVRLARMMT